jgi:hypothetical protein
MSEPVKTTKVQGRRELRFNSLEDIRVDVETLAASPNLRTLGNWSAGQIFQHLATTINCSIDGFGFTVSRPMRLMARLFKNKVLNGSMGPGFNLPRNAAERLLAPPTSLEDGLRNLRHALERMKSENQRAPSPFFGKMTNEDWVHLHCRHSELHLSFIVPEGKA